MIAANRTCSAASRTARRGYTYAELVVVLLLISVLTSVTVPIYSNGLEGYRADAAALRIAADLERARRNAKFTGVSREVDFDVGNNRYDVLGLPDPDDPTAALYRIVLDDTPSPATLVSAVLTSAAAGTDSKIKFDMYCHPTVSNDPLASGTIVVQSGSQQRTVVVDPVTGEARVQ